MLKRFFISMLGTIAGIWISSIILVAIIMACLAGVIASGISAADKPKVEKNSILHIDLSGEYVERAQPSSVRDLILKGVEETQSVCDLTEAVRRAANDPKIAGIYLECNGAAMDLAAREELAGALTEFRSHDKWIYAYADNYSQGDYYLATYADRIYLNPMGTVALHGLGGLTPFFKGLLEKLDINVQVVKVGTFKSAVEPFLLTEMSEPARLQAQTYIDSLWSYMASAIARNIGKTPADISRIASEIPYTWNAEKNLENGLATKLAYKREVQQILADETDTEYDDVKFITPTDYLKAKPGKNYANKNHIALLFAEGDIAEGGSGIASNDLVPDIIEMADDDNVRALVMRVNSGGGSAFASEQIWEALEYFKSKDKPFIVSMGGTAASGAYYISCGADYIFADTTTITGSIGVFGMVPDFSGLAKNKLGVTFSTVESNPNAAFPTPLKPMTPEQYAAMQYSVEIIYDTFTKRVAEGRKMTQDEVKAIGEGRVWAAGDAVKIGLVDTLGSLPEALQMAADKANVGVECVVYYPDYEEEIWQKLLRESGLPGVSTSTDPDLQRTAAFVGWLRSLAPIQARAEIVNVR